MAPLDSRAVTSASLKPKPFNRLWVCSPGSGAARVSGTPRGKADRLMGVRTRLSSPSSGCGAGFTISRCFTCGSSNASPILKIPPQGTPSAFSRSISSAWVKVRVISLIAYFTSARFVPRSCAVKNLGSANNWDASSAVHKLCHMRWVGAAILTWPSLASNVPMGERVG